MTQFTPGTRVTVAGDNGKLSPATVVNSSGFERGSERVTVHFDGKGIAVQPVHISRLAPLVTTPEPEESEYSEGELRAELTRRGASPKTTIAELGFWCDELGADPLAIFGAYVSLGFCAQDGANNA
ncbi:hypothetical protein [Glutamicibacter ardleyensis]|uniref:hypothetical protein n=1 Tax=Glutamicibacter ardleyensis TaxID=225894 RepID=UPI003FD02CA5